jgi:osmotically-inducible protein OsmY
MTVDKTAAHRTVGEKVDDSSITAQVKTSLLFHKSTHALATKVTTKNGVVTLHGEAKNGAERDLVTKLTEDIEGVKHVQNRMTVK